MLMRCRQREPAKMAIRIERFFNSIFHVKKYLHIRQLSFAGFAGFVAAFFRLFRNYIFLCAAKISSCNILSFLFTSFFIPIRQYLKPLKGRIKKKKDLGRLQARFPSPILLASQRWWLHPQNNSKLAQLSQLADQFIVYLAIVVTYSYSFTTFQTAYFWSSLGNCVEY